MNAAPLNPGTLYLVATPLGNLEDITLRALRVLRQVNLIAAEDTRITRKLLSAYDIHTPLTSFFEGNRNHKEKIIIEKLLKNETVALVCSAGTPCISDPGVTLVNSIWEHKLCVQSIPGPSALITALSISGLPTHNFLFLGFLPRRKKRMRDQLRRAITMEFTTILYESPFRIMHTLTELVHLAPNAYVVLVREATKKFEEVIRGQANTVAQKLEQQSLKGEMVLIFHPH